MIAKLMKIGVGLLFLSLVWGCKHGSDPDPVSTGSRTDMLVSNKWLLDRVTDAQGKEIDKNKLSNETLALFEFEFEFRANGVVRASYADTKQVINGGTWQFIDNETAIQFNITGIKNNRFGLNSLSRAKMILTNTVPVSGQNTDAKLEFLPSL